LQPLVETLVPTGRTLKTARAQGGWAFRYGQEAVAGDKFGLGEVLDTGVLQGDLITEVGKRKQARDIVMALVAAQTVGPAVRLIYTRDTGDGGGVRSSSRPR